MGSGPEGQRRARAHLLRRQFGDEEGQKRVRVRVREACLWVVVGVGYAILGVGYAILGSYQLSVKSNSLLDC